MAAKKTLKIDLSLGVDKQVLRPAERRRIALKNRIAQEAAKIFEEHGGEKGDGHDKTTAEEIAERSDISVRTFFRYYQSKTDAIYVDVPSATSAHLRLSKLLLEHSKPADASVAASVILLSRGLKTPAAVDRLLKAMSSETFVARRSALRQKWRQDLANLIEPYLDSEKDSELRSLTIATSTLNVREIAMEHWFRNSGDLAVVDCFNKALAINHATNQTEIPRSLSI